VPGSRRDLAEWYGPQGVLSWHNARASGQQYGRRPPGPPERVCRQLVDTEATQLSEAGGRLVVAGSAAVPRGWRYSCTLTADLGDRSAETGRCHA